MSIIPVDKELGEIIFVSGDNLIMNSFGTNSTLWKFFAFIDMLVVKIKNIILNFVDIYNPS